MNVIRSLILLVPFSVGVRTVEAQRAGASAPSVIAVGEARWWLDPLENKSSGEGHLYLAGVVENRGDVEVSIGVVFTAYLADGTPFLGCNGVGEPAAPVAPNERALIYCNRSIVPLSTKDLQVTMRVADVARVDNSPAPRAMTTPPALQRMPDGVYSASLRVSSQSSRDAKVSARFRFYDAEGIQVGYCDSEAFVLRPEVNLKLQCASPVIIPTGVGTPTTVKVELRGD
jgi:hypothetical protein